MREYNHGEGHATQHERGSTMKRIATKTSAEVRIESSGMVHTDGHRTVSDNLVIDFPDGRSISVTLMMDRDAEESDRTWGTVWFHNAACAVVHHVSTSGTDSFVIGTGSTINYLFAD